MKFGPVEFAVAKSFGVGLKPSRFVIGASTTTINLASIGVGDIPFTFEVSPDVVTDPTVSIRVDVSFDGGTTYANVGTFSTYSTRRWVRSPEELPPTHLMVYRVSGTSILSEFIIGA